MTYGYLIVLGLIFIGVGLILFGIDFLVKKSQMSKRAFWTLQSVLSISYLLFAFVTYMKWQEHNYIIFPKDFKGEAGIIFGMEGYPELPETKFWKKTISIPENGLIITSTKTEDIPSAIRWAFTDNSIINFNRIDWDSNFEIDCITSESKVRGWLFQVDGGQSSTIKNEMVELCNAISANQKKSSYKSKFSIISSDKKGDYLSLQNKGLTSLPNGLGKLNLYKAILTGNDLKELPPQILEISSLENLILAVNPINEFPCDLYRLKRLKSISIAKTEIKEINCDLSMLDSLEHFDIARNGLEIFPEQINSIPNLIWLSLNDNEFADFSFIDGRLNKLKTLDLYSNLVTTISKETHHLTNLKELLIFDNKIDSIPDNISDFESLEKLEIWDNPIRYISPNISKLTNLKSMRIDDDNLTQTDKDNLKSWLPNCKINYQTRSKKKNALQQGL
jgi:hypothetical protein